jgi:hypothetical protein
VTASTTTLRAFYARLPEGVRRCLRPVTLIEEVAARLPSPLRHPLAGAADRTRRLAHLHRARYAVRRLTGAAADGTPLTAVIAGSEHTTRFWQRTLFAHVTAEERLGVVHPLAVPRAAARAPDADLALWQISWPVQAACRGALLVPSWVPFTLTTDRPLDAIVTGTRSGRAARKNDVRRVAELGLVPRLVRDPETVDRFHAGVYAPYVGRRFGDLGVVLPRHVFHHTVRFGDLMLLEDRRGRLRGGTLLEYARDRARVVAFAVAPDEPPATMKACYWHAIRLAVTKGLSRLELGASRPVLTDGVAQYKRKCGAAVGVPTTLDHVWLRYRDTPGTRAVLTAAPLVVAGADRRLRALTGCRGTTVDEQLARIDTPGLHETLVLREPDTQMEWPAHAVPAS